MKIKIFSIASLIALTISSMPSYAVMSFTGQWGHKDAPDGFKTMSCFAVYPLCIFSVNSNEAVGVNFTHENLAQAGYDQETAESIIQVQESVRNNKGIIKLSPTVPYSELERQVLELGGTQAYANAIYQIVNTH